MFEPKLILRKRKDNDQTRSVTWFSGRDTVFNFNALWSCVIALANNSKTRVVTTIPRIPKRVEINQSTNDHNQMGNCSLRVNYCVLYFHVICLFISYSIEH